MRQVRFTGTLTPRSNFITTLAWIFIVVSGFAFFLSIAQNVMIQIVLPFDRIQASINQPEASHLMPGFFRFIVANIRTLFAAFLLFSAFMLVSSIGLLKRKNWARLIFIVIMVLGILWNIGGTVLQFHIFSSFPAIPEDAHEEFGRKFLIVFTMMKVFSVVMALGMSILFGWIIMRLSSRPVRKEFGVF
jgi:hypothetical protein